MLLLRRQHLQVRRRNYRLFTIIVKSANTCGILIATGKEKEEMIKTKNRTTAVIIITNYRRCITIDKNIWNEELDAIMTITTANAATTTASNSAHDHTIMIKYNYSNDNN